MPGITLATSLVTAMRTEVYKDVGDRKKSKRSPSCQALNLKREKAMTSKEILKQVKEMLEINTRVNWDGQWMEKDPVTPNQEFQNVLDFIEKKEKERSV